MKYLDQFLLEKRDPLEEGAYKTYETTPVNLEVPCREEPTEPTKPGSVGFVGTPERHIPNYAAPWPPRPSELALWPVKRRQRWGELANQLEDCGVPFPESERRAFEQIKAEVGT
jgi:hypothetical protein